MSPIVEAPIVGPRDDSLRGRDPLHGELRTDSTIRGQVKRGTGLINDELYIGRLVWNRLRCVKNPETGKRVSRVNPREEWIVTEVPEFRIVDDELWQAVKDRQEELKEKYATVIEATRTARANRLNGTHCSRHPKRLATVPPEIPDLIWTLLPSLASASWSGPLAGRSLSANMYAATTSPILPTR